MSDPKARQSRHPSESWGKDEPAREAVRVTALGWLRCVLRAFLLLALLLLGFPLLLLLRPLERAVSGDARPWTPWITQTVCICMCRVIGLRITVKGMPMSQPGFQVANHSTWLDVLVLNAATRCYFVAKADVRRWPVIGWLARGTGTHFVERRRQAAKVQETELSARLRAGHRLMIFPEGTSTDGQRVLAFKSTIFAPLYTDDVPDGLMVQPVSMRFFAPKGREVRFYGWWGAQSFGRSLIEILAQSPQGSVTVIWHDATPVAGHDRKSLAQAAQVAVAQGVEQAG